MSDSSIDLLMADIGFSSTPPSSVPDDDGWSRGCSSGSSRPVSAAPSSLYGDLGRNRPVIYAFFFVGLILISPPSVSVEIGPWDCADCTSDDPSVVWSDRYPELIVRFSGIPKLLHLPNATRKRIFNLKYLKTLEEVEAFKAWIVTLADPQGVLKRTVVEHKLMHRWLLRGIIHCLSNIPLEQWDTMEATTHLGEAQPAWNNFQTGISMDVIESFKKYEELDVRRAEEIELRKSTAVLRDARNEVSQCYANRTRPQSRNFDKARHTHAADSNVAALEVELSEMRKELTAARGDAKAEPSPEIARRVRELEVTVVDLGGKPKLAKAWAKSSSSGRIRAPKANVGATTSSELLASAATVAEGGSNVAGARRVSARKRSQADSSVCRGSAVHGVDDDGDLLSKQVRVQFPEPE
ncbi:hypothetical protein DFH09DRAFT_1287534 [Mycena vulgaris]|nr:hypothetical protein DFH09DRAFT_1287534 [Mycena vulgaris]